MKVKPIGPTLNDLSYGYYREPYPTQKGQDADRVLIYWPEIQQVGSWPIDALLWPAGGKAKAKRDCRLLRETRK